MSTIILTTAICTVFEVPDGLTIDQVRHAGLPDLSNMDHITDEVVARHNKSINRVFGSAAEPRSYSVAHCVTPATCSPPHIRPAKR